jgi:cytochrome b
MEKNKQVWDLAIRAFHWSLVVFFTITYLSGEEIELLHAYAGYVVIGLLVFRLFWGLVGTRTARFSSFIYSPAETLRYAKSFVSRNPIHYVGHNPIGAIMIFALLISLTLTCWTGLKAYAEEGKGPLAQTNISLVAVAHADDDEREHHDGESEYWQEIHETVSNLTLLLVFMHIAGVLLASVVHGENLVKTMITGKEEKVVLTDPD